MQRTDAFRPAVGVVGAGRFGLALAEIAARNGHNVVLYTSLPERAEVIARDRAYPPVLPELERLDGRVEVTTDPARLAARCALVLLTSSPEYLTRAWIPVGEALDGAHFVVHAVHMIDGADLARTSDMIQRHSCVKQIGVIAGPTHVSELLSERPNAAVVGTAFPGVALATQRALARHNFTIRRDPDMRAVELAAALGQIVAIAVGLGDGLGLGAAAHATLLTAGLTEVARVGGSFGASQQTFFGLAGVGRLVDAVERGEPNYQFGREFARNGADRAALLESALPEAQGVAVIRSMANWSREHGHRFEFADTLTRIFDGSVELEAAVRGLVASGVSADA